MNGDRPDLDEDLSSSRSSDFSMDDNSATGNGTGNGAVHQPSQVMGDDESGDKKKKDSFDSSKVATNLDKALDAIPEYHSGSAEGAYTWKIEDITTFNEEKVFGPKFEVGDYVFNPLVTTSKRQGNTYYSVYLEGHPKDSDLDASGDWSCCVQFALDVWVPGTSQHKMNSTHFRYNSRVTDWGFISLLDSRFRADNDIINKKRINITSYVRIIDDFTGVLWSDFLDYDSKKATGYVGINNQGATCYLNSLLQSYYFTKKFRKKVYQIPTEDEVRLDMSSFKDYLDQPKSVSLALQRIFYNLQTSDKPVDTTELTHSFGWTGADAFTQHDVQEMNRILMDKLESKMKHTDIEGCLNDIFVGKMKSFIRCVNVEYESSRIEDFWDIQLNVKGLKDINESFSNYCELELMDGENKYDAGEYGLQAAEKGVIFESFPPVLHLQLKRFEYDFEYDQLVKINDRHEFIDTLDLKPYIDKDSDVKSEDWEYKLHCVLVHQGEVSMGHYYAMIKPEDEDKWYRFDDDRVWRVTPNEVFEENFGADQDPEKLKMMTRDEQHEFQLRRHTSAYMLVYIRKSKLDEILADVKKDDVPKHIPLQISYENEQFTKIRKEQEEMHLYANFRVYYDGAFRKYQGFDLGPDEDDRFNYVPELFDPDSYPLKFRLLKTDSFSKAYDSVIEKLGLQVPANNLRFWIISSRKNHASRPWETIDYQFGDENYEGVTVDAIVSDYDIPVVRRRSTGTQSVQLTLYLEDATQALQFVSNSIYALQSQGTLPESVKSIEPFSDRYSKYAELSADAYSAKLESVGEDTNNMMLFLKFFDYPKQTLYGITQVIVASENSVDSITPLINNIMGFSANTPLTFWEEIGTSQIVPVSSTRSFYRCELGDGDILCFTKSHWNLPLGDGNKELKYSTPESFYSFMANRLHFRVAPLKAVGEDEEEYVNGKEDSDGNGTPGDGKDEDEKGEKVEAGAKGSFEMWFSYMSGYKELAQQIGEHVGVDPEYLRLFIVGHNNQNYPLKSTVPLKRLLERIPKSQLLDLRYEVLSVTLDDFEHMMLCKVYWVGQGICREQKHEFSLPRSATVADLVDRLQTKVKFKDEEKDSLLCWTMDGHHRFGEICTADVCIDQGSDFIVGPYPAYREVLRTKPKDIRLVTGFQFFGQVQSTHSLPFIFDLVRGESYKDTRVRLHKLLGISDREFNSMRVCVTDLTSVQYLDTAEKDSVQLYTYAQSMPFYIAIDHPDRSQRRTAAYEPSIQIRG